MQAKLATGEISAAEMHELLSVRSAGSNLISLRTIALVNLVRVSGKSEATSQEVGRLIAELAVCCYQHWTHRRHSTGLING